MAAEYLPLELFYPCIKVLFTNTYESMSGAPRPLH